MQAPALAGLRRGDLREIRWGDVDLANATLTIRPTVAKNKKEDVIPLHPQLLVRRTTADQARPRSSRNVHPEALPTLAIFPKEVQPLTVRKDLLRAGLAPKRYVTANGDEVTFPQARQLRNQGQRIRLVIDTRDPEGRVLDLHAG